MCQALTIKKDIVCCTVLFNIFVEVENHYLKKKSHAYRHTGPCIELHTILEK